MHRQHRRERQRDAREMVTHALRGTVRIAVGDSVDDLTVFRHRGWQSGHIEITQAQIRLALVYNGLKRHAEAEALLRSAVTRLERHCPTAGDGHGADADSEGWAVQVEPTHEWLAVSRRQLAVVRELLASDGL